MAKKNTIDDINNRKVEKIKIEIEIDRPDPMPMMFHEQVGTGREGDKEIVVDRNMSGSLLMIRTITRPEGEEPKSTGYVVEISQIVKGILAHEEQA